MSPEPSFEELVSCETADAERERLRRAHELLVEAGPPPELPPQLAAVPDFAGVHLEERRTLKRRAFLLVPAALAAAIAFAVGYTVAAGRGGSTPAVTTVALKGTAAAPEARATLGLLPARQGNRPLTLSVIGLPQLRPQAFYDLYLVRRGRARVSCGTFTVSSSSQALTVTLNDPYALRSGDSWVVTRTTANGKKGTPVLRSS